MRRRRVLSLAGAAAALPLAGCLDALPGGPGAESEPSEGVYVQTFQESMAMQGEATAGDYRVALAFTVPHDFWTVTGREVETVPKTDEDSLHLMAVVWDPRSGRVLPEGGVSVRVARDGVVVTEEVLYPMLSQTMGFHYGANVVLPGDGTYDARVRIGGLSIRRTGAFRDRFAASASAQLPLAFTDRTRERVATRPIEQGGDPGALAPMDTGLPQSVAPDPGGLPGALLGTGESGDAVFAATALDAPPAGLAGDGGGRYLVLSPRSRYNRFLLPAMGLRGTLSRGDETVFEGDLVRTFDPDLGYHYGATVPEVRAADRLRVEVTTPPQTARHEGYERAFLDLDPATVALETR
ncbi:iron transporter [Halomarina halobia]|uniref:Iron transporter n=1 Tax=Halomarina halobia TaxID=3033386 RepID=A0ABD6AB03_9EURY|nr:fe2+ transport protein [Halomarina sp. PSR21]